MRMKKGVGFKRREGRPRGATNFTEGHGGKECRDKKLGGVNRDRTVNGTNKITAGKGEGKKSGCSRSRKVTIVGGGSLPTEREQKGGGEKNNRQRGYRVEYEGRKE